MSRIQKTDTIYLVNPWSQAQIEYTWAQIKEHIGNYCHPSEINSYTRKARELFKDGDGTTLGSMIIGS